MPIQSHPTEAAAAANLEARGFRRIARDLLPRSWRADASRYYWHSQLDVAAMLYPRGAGWDAAIGLPSDMLSRTLRRYISGAHNKGNDAPTSQSL